MGYGVLGGYSGFWEVLEKILGGFKYILGHLEKSAHFRDFFQSRGDLRLNNSTAAYAALIKTHVR